MGTPVLLLVDEDRTALEALAGDVGRRFGVDHQIVAECSPVGRWPLLSGWVRGRRRSRWCWPPSG